MPYRDDGVHTSTGIRRISRPRTVFYAETTLAAHRAQMSGWKLTFSSLRRAMKLTTPQYPVEPLMSTVHASNEETTDQILARLLNQRLGQDDGWQRTSPERPKPRPKPAAVSQAALYPASAAITTGITSHAHQNCKPIPADSSRTSKWQPAQATKPELNSGLPLESVWPGPQPAAPAIFGPSLWAPEAPVLPATQSPCVQSKEDFNPSRAWWQRCDHKGSITTTPPAHKAEHFQGHVAPPPSIASAQRKLFSMPDHSQVPSESTDILPVNGASHDALPIAAGSTSSIMSTSPPDAKMAGLKLFKPSTENPSAPSAGSSEAAALPQVKLCFKHLKIANLLAASGILFQCRDGRPTVKCAIFAWCAYETDQKSALQTLLTNVALHTIMMLGV